MSRTGRKRKNKPVTLAQRAADIGLITTERAKMLGDAIEQREIPHGAGKVVVLQVSDSPLDRLHKGRRKDGTPFITQSQFEAGDRFRKHFYASGLEQLRATDWTRPYVDGGSNKPEPEFREKHLQEYNRAVAALRLWNLTVLRDVVLRETRLEDCASVRALYASEKDRGIAGLTELRIALTMLAEHWGMPKDWG